MSDWPVVPLFAFLYALAFLRGSATYAVGRGVRGAADNRTRLGESDKVRWAEGVVSRYGSPVVSLCFLTVGVQTAIIGAAGTLRMPLKRFVPALLVGALFWATIYVSVGFTVVEAFWGGRTWLLVAGVVALVALALVAGRLREWFATRGESPTP